MNMIKYGRYIQFMMSFIKKKRKIATNYTRLDHQFNKQIFYNSIDFKFH